MNSTEVELVIAAQAAQIATLKAMLERSREETRRMARYRDESATAAGEAQRRAEAAEAEVLRLKAKLYDCIAKEKNHE